MGNSFLGVTANSQAGLDTLTIPHSTSSGTNKMMIVSVFGTDDVTASDAQVASVLYGVNPLTKAIEQVSAGGADDYVSLWYLADPPEGNADVVVNWTGAIGGGGAEVSTIAGAAQTGPEVIRAGSGEFGSPINLTIGNTAAGAWIFDSCVMSDPGKVLTAGSGQTETRQIVVSGVDRGAQSYEVQPTASTSTVMSWSWVNNNRDWAIVAASFAPAAGVANTADTEQSFVFLM